MYVSHVGRKVKFCQIFLIFLLWHLWKSQLFLLVSQLEKRYLGNTIESLWQTHSFLGKHLLEEKTKPFWETLTILLKYKYLCFTQIKLQNRNARWQKKVILDNMGANHWPHKVFFWKGCKSLKLSRTRLIPLPHQLQSTLKTRKFLHFFFFSHSHHPLSLLHFFFQVRWTIIVSLRYKNRTKMAHLSSLKFYMVNLKLHWLTLFSS